MPRVVIEIERRRTQRRRLHRDVDSSRAAFECEADRGAVPVRRRHRNRVVGDGGGTVRDLSLQRVQGARDRRAVGKRLGASAVGPQSAEEIWHNRDESLRCRIVADRAHPVTHPLVVRGDDQHGRVVRAFREDDERTNRRVARRDVEVLRMTMRERVAQHRFGHLFGWESGRRDR